MGIGGKLSVDEIKTILNMCGYNDIKYFVETGTYKGDSTREAAQVFDTVHTIEINENLYNNTKNLCNELGITNIHFHLGDTVQLLSNIISSIPDKCFWFIDAHQSGPDTSNNGTWVPLLEELDIVLSQADEKSGVYVFDDERLFSKHWDWAEVSSESILDKFKSHGVKTKLSLIMNDRFIVSV